MHARWRGIPDRSDRPDHLRSHRAVALCFLFVSSGSLAEVSGSASLLSDYRYRGVSLSDHRPAAQVALAYDDASGWYGGAFASTVRLGYPTNRELQFISFAGFARRTPSGLSWEAGANYSMITGERSYGYVEAYVGLASEKASARLYYAPRYYGSESGVIYGEVNVSHELQDGLRLIAHGAVARNNIRDTYGARVDRHVFDASLGMVVDFDQFSAQLSWVGRSSANTPYAPTTVRNKNGVVFMLTRSF